LLTRAQHDPGQGRNQIGPHSSKQTTTPSSVPAFQGLVDANLVAWVHQRRLLILAWTVNQSDRFNQLVRLGVDGITTGNLAVLSTLSQ
jgi:glycerophosphoryl diester phosphodiesterase